MVMMNQYLYKTKNLMEEEPSEIDGILLYNNDIESEDE